MSTIARLLRWQDKIEDVADRWRRQYQRNDDGGGIRWNGIIDARGSEAIWRELTALPATATYQDVDRVIGTQGWATFWCDVCHDYVPEAVQIGDEPDYESDTVTLCLACYDTMIAQIAESRQATP